MNGEWIASEMDIEEGSGVWILKNCVVVETDNDYDLKAYEVYMETANSSISRQTVIPADVQACDECRAALDREESPVGLWEDGTGRTVDPDNGEIVKGGFSFESNNCNCGDILYFDTAEEAVSAAETAWNHLSVGNRKTYLTTAGAVFMVADPFGIEIRDFIAEGNSPKDEWRGFKKVSASGTSLTVAVTDACRELGIQRGEFVEVIIRRA